MHRNRTWQVSIQELRTQRNRILPIEGGDGSTLSLDFTTGVLDPRLAFTRGTNATFINSSGLVEWAAANFMTQSNNFAVSPWSSTNVTMSIDGSSPVGDAWKMLENNVNNVHRLDPSGVSYGNNGVPMTFSVYVKQGSGSRHAYFSISDNALGDVRSKRLNPITGLLEGSESVGGSWTNASTSVQSVGGGWYRLILTATKNSGTAVICKTGMCDSSGNLNYAGDGTSFLYFAGYQINPGTSAQAYNATTGSAYTAPRFNYDPNAIGTARGLLMEGSATNYSNYSETFPTAPASGTGWGRLEVTANATLQASPNGSENAIAFNETINNSIHRISHVVTAVAGPLTCSVWVKVIDGLAPRRLFMNAIGLMGCGALFDINPNVQTGASGNAIGTLAGTAANRAGTWVKYPNGWYRCSIVGTYNTAQTMYLQLNRASSTSATDDTYAGSTSNGLMIWGFQVEAGTGASSYIPTGASTGSRAADSAVMSDISSLNYSNTNGTLYWSGIINKQPTSYITLIGFMAATDQPTFETFGNALNYFTAARGASLNISGANEVSRPYVLGSLIKYASSVNTLQDPIVAVNLNGSAGSTNKSGTGDLYAATRFVLGRQPVTPTYGLSYPSVTIANIKYWPTTKTATELAALTA